MKDENPYSFKNMFTARKDKQKNVVSTPHRVFCE